MLSLPVMRYPIMRPWHSSCQIFHTSSILLKMQDPACPVSLLHDLAAPADDDDECHDGCTSWARTIACMEGSKERKKGEPWYRRDPLFACFTHTQTRERIQTRWPSLRTMFQYRDALSTAGISRLTII